jgi:hypothetical protein
MPRTIALLLLSLGWLTACASGGAAPRLASDAGSDAARPFPVADAGPGLRPDATLGGDAPLGTGACGDGRCDLSETCASCTSDCGPCPDRCGDGTCAAAETSASCPADCDGPPVGACGDGRCDASRETCASCSTDCGVCEPRCGDAVCTPGLESCGSCPRDCGTCTADPCAAHTDCGSCVDDDRCGFCASTGRCMAGTLTGPSGGSCGVWLWFSLSC